MFFSKWFRSTESKYAAWESWMIHLVTLVSFSIFALSIVYYFYRLTPSIMGFALCMAFVVGWATFPRIKKVRNEGREFSLRTSLSVFGSAAASILILATLWISRTDESIASPWQAVPAVIFILYAFGAYMTIRAVRDTSSGWSLPCLMLFGMATFGVSLIVYRLGFGYDPFVHQATERHILEHGFILPKQPMYIGQYVSVVTLSWISRLSVHRIDRVLVPLISVFLMIPMLCTAFRYGWMKKMEKPAIGILALFVIPIGYFAFTVPFNLTLIALVLIIAFLPLSDEYRIKWLIASLACASIVIHPLVGIPTALLAVVALFRKISPRVLAFGIPLFLFSAFAVYLQRQGASFVLPSWNHLWDVLLALFGNPYSLQNGQPYLAIFYALLYLSPLLLIGYAVYGYAESLPKEETHQRSVWILGYSSLGILASAVLIPLFFLIPNIIIGEQFEFSLRLLLILPLFWLPGIVYALHSALGSISKRKRIWIPVLLSLIIACAWYASYPQFNDISNAPAPGLSRGDLDTVEFIEGNAQGGSYVVLSSQMMGAAALMNFGFEKQIPSRDGSLYAYAIPTGGTLYQYYLRFIMGDEDPVSIQSDLNQYIDTPLVYLAIPDSWDPEGELTKRLQPVVYSQYEIGGNRIFKLKAVGRR